MGVTSLLPSILESLAAATQTTRDLTLKNDVLEKITQGLLLIYIFKQSKIFKNLLLINNETYFFFFFRNIHRCFKIIQTISKLCSYFKRF